MKKVLLLGDSIRLGYENYVKDTLLDVAELYSPKDNCAFAQYMLRYVHEWADKENYPKDIDLIHWNVGLWDVLRIYGDQPFTPPAFYGDTIERIFNRLKALFPKAKQVFALSTAVQQELYTPPYERRNLDIERLNQVAIEKLTPLGVQINDLYSITKDVDSSYHSDMTHFSTPKGVELLGSRVVKIICENLDISFSEVKRVKAKVTDIDEKILGR